MPAPPAIRPPLGWLGIVRLGLVQTALGAIVVLTTSTINRVMVVELALPAILPGLLVALHYAVQVLRPRWGHGSDVGGRLTPWILGGMAVLALGGFGAALSVALMASLFWPGVALAALSFLMIGMGVGASGTCLLVLLSRRVADERAPSPAGAGEDPRRSARAGATMVIVRAERRARGGLCAALADVRGPRAESREPGTGKEKLSPRGSRGVEVRSPPRRAEPVRRRGVERKKKRVRDFQTVDRGFAPKIP